MKRFPIASLGWLMAGIISAIVGVVMYKTSPILGSYYMLLGVVAIVIGVVIVRALEQYRRVVVRRRRLHRQSS